MITLSTLISSHFFVVWQFQHYWRAAWPSSKLSHTKFFSSSNFLLLLICLKFLLCNVFSVLKSLNEKNWFGLYVYPAQCNYCFFQCFVYMSWMCMRAYAILYFVLCPNVWRSRDFDAFDLRKRLPAVISKLYKAINRNGGVTYIHCTAGLGRAPAVAVCMSVSFLKCDFILTGHSYFSSNLCHLLELLLWMLRSVCNV